MPAKYVAKPFEVYAQQWWPEAVIEGVYRIDRHAPAGVPRSRTYSQDQCGWTFAQGRLQLVEPGDTVVDTIDGRMICKPDTFERSFAPFDQAVAVERQAI